MRTFPIIAIAALILAGIGAQILLPEPSAESLGVTIGATPQAPTENFSQDCARKDIGAITSIEDHGTAGDLSSDLLGQAGLTMLRARMACYEGRVGEALALYDGILNLAPVASLSGQR